MKKTVYIHIGSRKTGTTSIQQFLTINAEPLSQEGVFYPLIGGAKNGAVLLRDQYNERDFKKLLSEFSAHKNPTMLLSEEKLFCKNQNNILNRPNLFKHLSQYDMKIIIYLRRSVEYLSGSWKEDVKFKAHGALERYLDVHPYTEQLQLIHDLAERIGKENIIVRPFEKEAWVNENLIDDFLSLFNLKNSNKFNYLEGNKNIGFSRERSEMFRYINQYVNVSIGRDDYGINQKIPAGKNNQSVLDSLPDEIIKKITDRYYPHECDIAQKFLGRKELFSQKYPKIYKTKREHYINKFTEEDRQELHFIINATLQTQMLERHIINPGVLKKMLYYIFRPRRAIRRIKSMIRG